MAYCLLGDTEKYVNLITKAGRVAMHDVETCHR